MLAARLEDASIAIDDSDVEPAHTIAREPTHAELRAQVHEQIRQSARWADVVDSSESSFVKATPFWSRECSAAEPPDAVHEGHLELMQRAEQLVRAGLMAQPPRGQNSTSEWSAAASGAASFVLQTPTGSREYLSQASASALSEITARTAQLGKRTGDGYSTPCKRPRSGVLPASPVAEGKEEGGDDEVTIVSTNASSTDRVLTETDLKKREWSICVKKGSKDYKAYRLRYPTGGPAPTTPDPRDSDMILFSNRKWRWHHEQWFRVVKDNAKVGV